MSYANNKQREKALGVTMLGFRGCIEEALLEGQGQGGATSGAGAGASRTSAAAAASAVATAAASLAAESSPVWREMVTLKGKVCTRLCVLLLILFAFETTPP